MLHWALLLHFLSSYADCLDAEAYNLQVKYLEDLVNVEVEKAKNYRGRNDNGDLLDGVENSRTTHDFGTFDFIVVGGGSAGSVVANRLSEIRGWKVLLLEAGDINDDFTDIPYVFDASARSDRNWGYLTVPQKNGCYGRENRRCPYIRGKILGGSGTINGLVYSRGIKADFEKWAQEGNSGWSWEDVFPYIKKIENFQSQNVDSKYRGFNGPLNIAYAQPDIPLQKAFIQASKEIGIPFLEDYNAEKVSGVSYIQHNIQNGKRVSGANNYLRPAWTRINLNITLRAFVTKVLIDEQSKTAYGVEFVHKNRKFKANARREVILSGGSANTPQLLMLSGIGPKSDLQKVGIKVIQDSPVGKFMKDHIGFLPLYFSSNYVEPAQTTNQLIKQYLQGEGAFTAPSYYRAIAYFNTRNKSSPFPNMEIDFAPPRPVVTTIPQFANYRKEVSDYVNSINQSTHWNFQLFFLHPKSSGTLTLQSANARDFPLIDSKIFDKEEDLEDMYEGIQVALKLVETSVGKHFDLKLNLDLPSCSKNKRMSREYLYCLLRQVALPAYHLSSTAKMGPRSDPLAVVNNELKVYGIKNLRVIDVSIVPSTVTGHINAQAFLIGEKGADMIKKDHLNIQG
ncbi:glucose dehydrogenase [FAD, quinone]-like [Coccinella septempunctata]|uniref:glucose dehydrogenase [FAD, quinone]-like n=1 Tax=Coccinella septempunctata TaxID=41139 RepID=UPI001D08584E|nr:glucose dehydrogenase [FAD, quinone]-like [Coccinella septempunctata]